MGITLGHQLQYPLWKAWFAILWIAKCQYGGTVFSVTCFCMKNEKHFDVVDLWSLKLKEWNWNCFFIKIAFSHYESDDYLSFAMSNCQNTIILIWFKNEGCPPFWSNRMGCHSTEMSSRQTYICRFVPSLLKRSSFVVPVVSCGLPKDVLLPWLPWIGWNPGWDLPDLDKSLGAGSWSLRRTMSMVDHILWMLWVTD